MQIKLKQVKKGKHPTHFLVPIGMQWMLLSSSLLLSLGELGFIFAHGICPATVGQVVRHHGTALEANLQDNSSSLWAWLAKLLVETSDPLCLFFPFLER